MKRISKVKTLPGYRLDLEFDDGVRGIVDVSEHGPDALYLKVTGKKPEDLFPALRDRSIYT